LLLKKKDIKPIKMYTEIGFIEFFPSLFIFLKKIISISFQRLRTKEIK